MTEPDFQESVGDPARAARVGEKGSKRLEPTEGADATKEPESSSSAPGEVLRLRIESEVAGLEP